MNNPANYKNISVTSHISDIPCVLRSLTINSATATATIKIEDCGAGAELIANNSFATAGAGDADVFGSWTETVPDGTLTDDHQACKIQTGATTNATRAQILQAFAVEPGQQYRLKIKAKGDGTGSGFYRVYDVTNSADIIAEATLGNTTATEKEFTVVFTAPAGCFSARLYLYAAGANGRAAVFSEVSVVPIITETIFNTITLAATGTLATGQLQIPAGGIQCKNGLLVTIAVAALDATIAWS